MSNPRGFIWWSASPTERAMMIREHYIKMGSDAVKRRFCLTDDGLSKIVAGDCWRQEYEAPAVNEIDA